MNFSEERTEKAQQGICLKYGVSLVPASGDDKTGFALSTKGLIPINGLRHPIHDGMSGWFIWCGEEFSDAADFFTPLHTRHIYEGDLEIGHLLGLPPGFRFLQAGDFLDIWYDETLLDI